MQCGFGGSRQPGIGSPPCVPPADGRDRARLGGGIEIVVLDEDASVVGPGPGYSTEMRWILRGLPMALTDSKALGGRTPCDVIGARLHAKLDDPRRDRGAMELAESAFPCSRGGPRPARRCLGV